MTKSTIKVFIYLFIFLLSFKIAFAQVVITEIMYDLPKDSGSDTGREWVEIFNSGNKNVDMSGWRFYEAKTNHKLKLFKGGNILPAGGYAIIADNPKKFFADNTGFKGTIFDSSFSLKNTGESIAIRDSSLVDIDSVIYNSKQGAKGDGNSLQKIDNSWVASLPTPGSVNSGNQSTSVQVGIAVSDSRVKTQKISPLVTSVASDVKWSVSPKIFAHIKVPSKIAVVGSDILLKGEALGLEKKPLPNARYLWTLGDGGVKEGKGILYRYDYVGKYVVVLNTSSGKYSASDRVVINVIPNDIKISSVGTGSNSFVELYNKTKYELNLSLWQLRAGSKNFVIPKDTVILPKSKIIFPPQNTKFRITKNQKIELLYSNGFVANTFTWVLGAKVKLRSKVVVYKKNNSNNTLQTNSAPKKTKIVNNIKSVDTRMMGTTTVGKNQSANVFTAGNDSNGIYKWILGLFGILSVAIFAVFLIRKEKYSKESQLPNQKNTDADEYEIIEE